MKQQEKKKDRDLLLEKLRNDESFYKDILSTQIDWIWEVNEDGIYTYCSERIKDFLGYTPQEILGKTPFDFMPSEEATRVSAIFNEIAEKQKPIVNLENWNLHKNGNLVCFLTNGISFYDKNGNWLGYRGIDKDISKLKKAEQKLRESEEMYRAIIETAKDCIFIKNSSLQYIQVNPAMEKLSGIPAEELKNKTDIDLFGENVGKHLMKIDRRVINGEIIEEEPTIPIRGIPHTFHTIKVPLKDSNGNIFSLCGIARDITEGKKIKEALKESEEKYRLISENASDLIVVVNHKFEIEYMNDPIYRKSTGYPREEVIGKSVTEFIHPDDLKKAIEAFRRGLKTGEGMEEIRFKQKTGNWNWLEIRGKTFIDNKGQKKALFIARDITEKKKAMEALKESEEKYRLISENAKDMIAILNEKFKFEYINEITTQKILGYSKDDLIGKNAVEFIHPDDFKNLSKVLRKSFKKGEGMVELRIRKKDGTYIWVELGGKRFLDKEGAIKGVFVSREITNRKKVEEKLKESEKKYRGILENIIEGYFEVDLKGNFTFVNDFICEFLGYSREDLLGMNYREILDKETIEDVFKRFNKVYKNEIPTSNFESKVLRNDGKIRSFEGSIYLKYNTQGQKNGFYGFTRDITERKKAEQKLIKSEEKYREAYNLADFYKDLFAHDMNNILQNILSSAALCELYLYEPEKLKDMSNLLKILKDQVKRGANLISNVLKLSQLEETQIITQSTEVYTILQKAVKFIQDGIQERKLKIKVDIPWKKIHIYANDLLIDVFENILFNAVKYNENPIIEISILLSKIQKEGIKYLKIEFKDNGIGIQDSKKEIIFQRGYKKDISIKGMGLGLSLVKKILTGYNGEIWVEDRVKGDYTKGSNFVILIPEAV